MRSVLWITVSLALMAVAGCGDTDDVAIVPPPPVPEQLPFADTPDKLIANFQTVYGGMDIAAYRDAVLADAYEFILQNETVEEFELPDGVFDRDEELAIAERMFSGQANFEGKVLTVIEIQVFEPEGAWLPVPSSDLHFGEVPGALMRNYSVLIYFNVQGNFRYVVDGNQIFYVAPHDVMHEGVLTPCYRLRGQLDLSSLLRKQGVENATWSSVKARWS